MSTKEGRSFFPTEFLFFEFAACSKPPSRDNHRKVPYQRMQQRDQGAGYRLITSN